MSDVTGPVEVVERIEVAGVVQGVGFRPFIHGLAMELGLRGRVANDSGGVVVDVAGPAGVVDAFAGRLVTEAPPLASVDRVVRTPLAGSADLDAGFRITASRAVSGSRTLVPPDAAVCDECRRELFDPGDRRFRHPFITCTNCGPRFTIITALPYDRSTTTMAGFAMCPDCQAEYDDPTDRRHHAQPICCHWCGPRVTFRSMGASNASTQAPIGEPIVEAAAAIARGVIVAVKGLGGYHVACDARSTEAVAELRRRKHRPDKPFAVMVAELDSARSLAEVGEVEAALLTSSAAPIVLLRARPDSPLSPLVAPGSPLDWGDGGVDAAPSAAPGRAWRATGDDLGQPERGADRLHPRAAGRAR